MSRSYDLVIYGATGFTGSLACRYVARQYAGSSLRWAIAGRSRGKLEALAAKSGGPGVIIAEADDDAALAAMCQQTKSVAACAGPFARYGKKLVAACVSEGTDYCDITGEMGFVREMIALHDDAAKASGSRIVHLCGHDSIPWDLSTLMLSRKLGEKGATGGMKRVDFFTDIKSAPSGGTLETAFGILFGADGKERPHAAVKALGFDPLLKTRAGSKSTSATAAKNVSTLALDAGKALTSAHPLVRARPYRAFFFMAGVNANAVKRSNAVNGYGDKVTYCEGLSFKSAVAAVRYLLGLMVLGLLLAIPPTRYLMRRFVLPKPGEGPSEESMAKGYLIVSGVATAASGEVATSTMRFPVDPGYVDTARMVVESALTLALDGQKLEDKAGGVFTPGCCQGLALLDRLCASGTTFECS